MKNITLAGILIVYSVSNAHGSGQPDFINAQANFLTEARLLSGYPKILAEEVLDDLYNSTSLQELGFSDTDQLRDHILQLQTKQAHNPAIKHYRELLNVHILKI